MVTVLKMKMMKKRNRQGNIGSMEDIKEDLEARIIMTKTNKIHVSEVKASNVEFILCF